MIDEIERRNSQIVLINKITNCESVEFTDGNFWLLSDVDQNSSIRQILGVGEAGHFTDRDESGLGAQNSLTNKLITMSWLNINIKKLRLKSERKLDVDKIKYSWIEKLT